MGGGWTEDGRRPRRLRGHSRRIREDRFFSPRSVVGRDSDRIAARDVADASGVPRGWRPSRRGRGLDPPSAATQPAPRTFERGRRAKILQNEPSDSRGCPPEKWWSDYETTRRPRRRSSSLRGAPGCRTRGDAMQARRGANFVTNAMPFFAFMVGGSYGISVLLQVRDREAPASTSRVASRSQHALTTRTRRTPRTHHTRRVATTCATRRRT